MSIMTSKMLENYTGAQDFLINTRKLPPELRWKICGMVEAANLFNVCHNEDAKSEQAQRPGA